MADFRSEITGADLAAALDCIEDFRAGRLPRKLGALSTAGLLAALTFVAASTFDVLDPADADAWTAHLRRQSLAATRG